MILYAEVECFLYEEHSLKSKRSVLKKIFARLKNDFNVSLAELDYQDLWQRTKIGIVIISSDKTHAEKVIQQVLVTIDAFSELERTITTVEEL